MKLKIELELEYTTHWADEAKVEVADIPALGLKTQAKPENIERAAISAAQMWLQICLDRGTILAWKKAGLGAAVSASPQPSVDELAAVMAYQHQSHTPESRKKLWDEETGPWKEQWRRTAQIVIERFFAAAPAQEPDSDLLARYNRAYSILGEALNLNAEYYGLVEMAQVAANRLTGKYDVAQEQPVENSPQKGKP